MIFKEAEIEQIAVINFQAISEVFLSIPVTRALKVNYPNAKLTMIVNVEAKDAAEMNPYVGNVIAYDKEGEHKGISGFLSFLNTVRASSFDLALTMGFSLRCPMIAWAAGIKYRTGYGSRFSKVFLTEPVEEQRQRIQHQTINYLQLLAPLAIAEQDTSLKLAFDEKTEKIVDVTMLLNTERPNVVFCPFNLHRLNSSFPLDKSVKLVLELERFSNIYLIGGMKEQALLASVAEKAELPPERVLAGKLNLKELAVFLKHIKVMLTVEACTMYVAQAVGIPVVALFGPGDPRVYGPCGNRDVTLSRRLGCMPCSLVKECLDRKCMDEIPLEDIIDKVAEIIQKEP